MSASKPITIRCPKLSCGKTSTVSESLRGKVVRCSACNELLMVPLKETPAAPPPQSQQAGDAKNGAPKIQAAPGAKEKQRPISA